MTGASGGLGSGLALAFSGPGVRVVLTGRNREKLDTVAEACTARGADVSVHVLDVSQRQAMEAMIAEEDAKRPLDLVIANAGINTMDALQLERSASYGDSIRRIVDVNIVGVLNTLLPALPLMRRRRAGHLVVMSSLASYAVGLPTLHAYAGSKMAVRSLGEGLRYMVAADGVRVTTLCPGFVRSGMTQRHPDRFLPLLMDTEAAVEEMAAAIRHNHGTCAFPGLFHALVASTPSLPLRLREVIGAMMVGPRDRKLLDHAPSRKRD